MKRVDKIELSKIALIGFLLTICLLSTYYFHCVLKTEVVFTHLFYVPIILASLWWGYRGIAAAAFLSLILMVAHIMCPLESLIWADMMRASMFLIVSAVVAILNTKKKYADDLKRSNELKDMFTDILRHDLLNPAGLMKGYTEILLERENDETKLHALQKIEKNNDKLIDLIESAAKFAKLESTDEIEFNAKDIGTIIKDVVGDFSPVLYEKQMTLDFVAEGEHLANLNPIIGEVFANLLSNAIKYSSNESHIIVDILDLGKKWKVTVTDFGEGISDDDKSNVFTRFKRVGKGNVKGSGLGLAIVKRIIELHEGEVGVEDNPAGQGSVFWVTLNKAKEH